MSEREDRSESGVPSAPAPASDTARARMRIGEAVPDPDMPILPLEGTARIATERPPSPRFDSEHTIVDPFSPGALVPSLEDTRDDPIPGDDAGGSSFFEEDQDTNLIDRWEVDDPTDRTSPVPAADSELERTATELAPAPSPGRPRPLGPPAIPRTVLRPGPPKRMVRLPLQGGDSERNETGPDDLMVEAPRGRASGKKRSRLPLPGVASMSGIPARPNPGPPRITSARRASSRSMAPSRPSSPLVGGRYRILSRIGEGGMGKVLKVEHAQLGKTFALKIISEDLAGKQKARESFYREARLASSLSHPNVATVVDFGEDPKLGAFMVMELLEGEELSRILRREGQLGVRQALDLIEQVAEALHYIHGSGIIHCDIKTDNIFLVELPGTQRRRKQVKLLDFGLARSMNARRHTVKLSGTPQYVAPERIRGARPSPASDIYGLGILLYELITGTVPFDGTIEHILSSHLEAKPRAPSKAVPNLEPAVEKLILRALQKNPDDRHKDVSAFLYELRAVSDMLGFGRKRGGRRVVVGRAETRRGDMARAVFDANRVPMAVLDSDGTIVLANASFAKFVMGVAISVEGLKAQSTALASTWSQFESDLARACRGTSVQRILEVDIAAGRTRRLLIWLDPSTRPDQAVFGVHPLEI